MIFVTVGTNEAPFERLLQIVDGLALTEEVVAQVGPASARPRGARCVAFLDFDELVSYVREARAVVTHAGVGSVMVALREGRRPIVLPRLRRFGEAVDDHQLHFARRAAGMGLVTLVEDAPALEAALGSEAVQEPRALAVSTAIASEIHDYLSLAIQSR